jgi:hypothetical protein
LRADGANHRERTHLPSALCMAARSTPNGSTASGSTSPSDSISATIGDPQNPHLRDRWSLVVTAPHVPHRYSCVAGAAGRGVAARVAKSCSRTTPPTGVTCCACPQYGHVSVWVPAANSTLAPHCSHG